MSGSWTQSVVISPHNGDAFPLAVPPMSQEEASAAVGFSLLLVCPVGCHHFLAAETQWPTLLEVALSRLQMTPGHDGLLIMAHYPPKDRADFLELKQETDAHFRGLVN